MKRRILLVVLALACLLAMFWTASAQAVPPNLDLGRLPGLALEDNAVLVAIPLENVGRTTADNVVLEDISLRSLARVKPASLPMSLGAIQPGKELMLQLSFDATDMREGIPYLLSIAGTFEYKSNNRPQRFRVNRILYRPQANEGESPSLQAELPPQQANGAIYPPDDRGFRPDQANEEEELDLPLPEGKLRGNLFPDDPPSGPIAVPNPEASLKLARQAANAPVTFFRVGTQNVQNNINSLFPWDPSGASVDVRSGEDRLPTRLVFLTGNTYALMSTDGGGSFTRINPTTIFPNNVDGGLCCDQVVQYVPSINRIVWFMQFSRGAGTNRNRIRIASASPQQVISSNATSWTYWDMTSATFNLGNNWMDYPDLAFTNNFLFISTDRVGLGLFVIRIPLTEIRDSVTIHLRYTDPANGGLAYGSHLTQDLTDRMYWFGHVSTSSLRVFRWLDSSTSYSWRTMDVNSWNNSDYATNAPNSVDWLSFGFGRSTIRGATHRGDATVLGTTAPVVRVAWSAGRGGGFAQPYVRMVEFADVDIAFISVLVKLSESQIWNSNFAFQHPYLTTNSEGEIGISVGFGGPSNHATPLVGFVGDNTLYYANTSSTTINRWGDYSAIRKHPNDPRLFSVSNYFLQSQAASGVSGGRVVHQYIMFGRSPVQIN
jgi:hypothetical protein